MWYNLLEIQYDHSAEGTIMKKYTDMTAEELQAELKVVEAKYEELKGKGLSLNMARGNH